MAQSHSKHKPFAHQEKALKISSALKNFALFMEMGTGKTKVILDTAMELHRSGKIFLLFVVAPKGTYMNWCEKEIPTHLHDTDYELMWWKGSKKTPKGFFTVPTRKLKIFVMNVEAFSSPSGAGYAEKVLGKEGKAALLVVDESTSIRTFNSKRTKALLRLSRLATYKRIMTGAPILKGPLNLYSQFAFLSPDILGYPSYYAFRNHFAVMKTIRLPTHHFQQVVGYRNTEELQGLIAPHSFRITKKECLDLPPKIYQQAQVEFHPQQKAVYETLRDEAIAEFQGGVISATQALTLLLRLHQVLCGHLKTDEGELLDVPNYRLDVLQQVIEETEGKVIIWCCYQRDVEKITKTLTDAGNDVVQYYGKTSAEDRGIAIKRFMDVHEQPRFFVGTVQTGGMGITLTSASTVIYYANNFNLEHRLQSEDRAHRIGQEQAVTYVDLFVPGTVDEKVTKALREKKSIADNILDNWRNVLNPF